MKKCGHFDFDFVITSLFTLIVAIAESLISLVSIDVADNDITVVNCWINLVWVPQWTNSFVYLEPNVAAANWYWVIPAVL